MKNLSSHWDKVFKATAEEKLGWFETDFSQTRKMLGRIPDWQHARIFVPGVGISGLVEILLESDAQLVLNDLSSEAIAKAKHKFREHKNRIQWLCQDISVVLPAVIENIDLWIDRAVLHFLIDDSHIEQYFKNLHTVVKPGGHVLLAEYSKKGASRCAGLDVRRYDVHDLGRYLDDFKLLASEEYTYIMPSGDSRPYIYALFKRADE